MLNIRNESRDRQRGVSISADGATGWSAMRFDEHLPETICMGSIIRLTQRPAYQKNRILFANPHNPESRKRENLSIKLSYDEGETWPVMRAIEPGASGYSDLAVGPDGTVYCFYERGAIGNHYQTQYLCVARFNLEWITRGEDHLVRQNDDPA